MKKAFWWTGAKSGQRNKEEQLLWMSVMHTTKIPKEKIGKIEATSKNEVVCNSILKNEMMKRYRHASTQGYDEKNRKRFFRVFGGANKSKTNHGGFLNNVPVMHIVGSKCSYEYAHWHCRIVVHNRPAIANLQHSAPLGSYHAQARRNDLYNFPFETPLKR